MKGGRGAVNSQGLLVQHSQDQIHQEARDDMHNEVPARVSVPENHNQKRHVSINKYMYK